MSIGLPSAAPGASGGPGGAAPLLGLVGGDLLVHSRVAGLAAQLGWSAVPVRNRAEAEKCRLLLFDLNREVGSRLELLAEVVGANPSLSTVCFGAHVEVAGWRPRARALGAGVCTVNSRLLDVLRRQLPIAAAPR